MLDIRSQKEKVNRCIGCAFNHPSQRQHSYVFGQWLQARQNVGRIRVQDAEIPLHIALTSLEPEGYFEIASGKHPKDRILCAVYYAPNGLQWEDFSRSDNTENSAPYEVQFPETIAKKKEQSINIGYMLVKKFKTSCMYFKGIKCVHVLISSVCLS